jgi:general secretion pathway protein E
MSISREHWSQLGIGGDIAMPANVYRAVGCLECRQTGYRGRSGVYELMPLNATLQSAIDIDADLVQIRRLALAAGMRTLRTAGAEKVAAGVTSIDEVLALTPDPRER